MDWLSDVDHVNNALCRLEDACRQGCAHRDGEKLRLGHFFTEVERYTTPEARTAALNALILRFVADALHKVGAW